MSDPPPSSASSSASSATQSPPTSEFAYTIPSFPPISSLQHVGTSPSVSLLRRLSINFFHFLRLGGWFHLYLVAFWFCPLHTIAILLLYYKWASHQQWWISLIRRWAVYSTDPRFRLVKLVDIDPSRTYLICGHPHGILTEGCFYSVSVNRPDFYTLFPGVNFITTAAKEIRLMPIFREIFDQRHSPPSRSNMLRMLRRKDDQQKLSLGVIPGGFSEAVFSDASSEFEYAYLKGRKGFIELAIEAGVDILPVYQFGVTNLYSTPTLVRGLRARLAQQTAIPMVVWFGKWGTSVPLGNFPVYTVVGHPFPASRFPRTASSQAHRAYCSYLQSLYDHFRSAYGMQGKTLQFIGKDFYDDDIIANSSRWLGIHTSKRIEGERPHREEWKEMKEQKKKREREEREREKGRKIKAAIAASASYVPSPSLSSSSRSDHVDNDQLENENWDTDTEDYHFEFDHHGILKPRKSIKVS